MSEGFEPTLVQVRADTTAFARDVAAMRASLDGPLQAGADQAGRAIETTLLRAVMTGKLGFEDLGRVALAVLGEIAGAAAGGGFGAIVSGGGRGGGLGTILAAALGASGQGFPGRATGGPVSPQRPYLVGERGPELFVPTASGRVEAAGTNGFGGAARTVNVAIRVQADAGTAPAALQRSSRQVARAVRAALSEER